MRILVVDDTAEIHVATGHGTSYAAALLLFWAAPETRAEFKAVAADVFDLGEVILDYEAWQDEAIEIARAAAAGGPRYRSLPVRHYLEEALFYEALTLATARRVVGFIRNRYGADSRVDCMAASRMLAAISEWVDDGDYWFHLAGVQGKPARPRRLVLRMREAFATGQWIGQAWNLAAEIDRRYRLRTRQRRRSEDVTGGGITLLSSYLNNSRSLAAIEGWLPGATTWIVLNYYARRGVGSSSSSVHWLWEFSPGKVVDEALIERGRAIEDSIAGASWLTAGSTWQGWVAAENEALARLTACWERYLDTAAPRLVVVANQWGVEGWLLRIARARGIPTLQLMHGVPVGTSRLIQQAPLHSDGLVVWGHFWRSRWPAMLRDRIVVANPGVIHTVQRDHGAGPRRVTLFSAPIERIPFLCASEWEALLVGLLDGLLNAGHEVTIRAHPLEHPRRLLDALRRHAGTIPRGVKVSKVEPLAEVLAQTDVAITLFSTVMLDCVASGIPVIVPGWMDYGWSRDLTSVPGINVARDASELLELARKETLPEVTSCDEFVAPAGTGRAEFESLVARLTSAPHVSEGSPLSVGGSGVSLL